MQWETTDLGRSCAKGAWHLHLMERLTSPTRALADCWQANATSAFGMQMGGDPRLQTPARQPSFSLQHPHKSRMCLGKLRNLEQSLL